MWNQICTDFDYQILLVIYCTLIRLFLCFGASWLKCRVYSEFLKEQEENNIENWNDSVGILRSTFETRKI